MTSQKHLKRRVRDRMQRTGERYAAARRHVLASLKTEAPIAPHPYAPHHRPGQVPAVAALRVLLAAAGHDLDEALVFGLLGGIGVGVFQFEWQKADSVSLFVAGRHQWWDDAAALSAACDRLGAPHQQWETGGARTARKHLDAALTHGPVIVWSDTGSLPYRGMPPLWAGGGYHVLTVHAADAERVWVSDCADAPIEIARASFDAARARIKKQKNRLLALTGPLDFDLATACRDALKACVHGLVHQRQRNFTLDALDDWAQRLASPSGKQSWRTVFTPGHRLWIALTSLHDFSEHYGTGGGLCRPLFADFLSRAATILGDARLNDLADRYADLGRRWSALAYAALPDGIAPMARAAALYAEKAEAFLSDGAASTDRYVAIWSELDALAAKARVDFPMSVEQIEVLFVDLERQVASLAADERSAAEALRAIID